jgi:REP element-mobilizing transposase RayT
MIYEKNGFYHIYNRGCNREQIFFCENDYELLTNKIEKTIVKSGINIIAYCLMPNHYHFLVQQLTDEPVSSWTKFLFNSYVQIINHRENRKGTLFEGKVQPKVITYNKYLIQIIQYIHYNPVAAKLVESPEDWKYSNYLEFIGKRKSRLFDEKFFFDHFQSFEEYEKLMKDYKMNKEMIEDYIIEKDD